MADSKQTQSPDFVSGESGTVLGARAKSLALLKDVRDSVVLEGLIKAVRLNRKSRSVKPLKVLVAGVERPDPPTELLQALYTLKHSRHSVDIHLTGIEQGGKFENINYLLSHLQLEQYDWLVLLDDDVYLPKRFLDKALFLLEHFDISLASPAQMHRSHAAWQVTRRVTGSLLRETNFAEIGPVTLFHRRTFEKLLPFPQLKMGWGLDAHWAAIAKQEKWRQAVIDATPVLHSHSKVASSYSQEEALHEATEFLSSREYLTREDLQRTLRCHRTL